MAFDISKIANIWGLFALVGLVFTILAIRVKGKTAMGINKMVPAALGALLVVGGVYQSAIFGNIPFGQINTIPATQSVIPQVPIQSSAAPPVQSVVNPDSLGPQQVVGGKICVPQSDGTNSLFTDVRNKLNASLGYLAATAAAESTGGNTLDSATTTGGATLSYLTLNVVPCQEGQIYVLASSGIGVASAKMTFSSFEPSSTYDIESANSHVLSVLVRDTGLNSISNMTSTGGTEGGTGMFVSGTGTADGTSYVKNQTMAAGDTFNHYLDYKVNGTAAVFGSFNQPDGTIFSFDSGTASKYSATSLSLQDQSGVGLTPVTCPPTIVSNRNAETCWSTRTLKSTDGEIRFKAALQADRADPAASDTQPRVCADEKVYFRDTNGKVAYDFFSSSGTNQGVYGTCIQYNNV